MLASWHGGPTPEMKKRSILVYQNCHKAIIFPPGTDSISARVANIDTLTYNAGSTMVKTGRTATVRLALFGGLLHP